MKLAKKVIEKLLALLFYVVGVKHRVFGRDVLFPGFVSKTLINNLKIFSQGPVTLGRASLETLVFVRNVEFLFTDNTTVVCCETYSCISFLCIDIFLSWKI